MIDGGSIPVRDCGYDRPQLVDNVGEIGGDPKFHQLEPAEPLAAPIGGPTKGRVAA